MTTQLADSHNLAALPRGRGRGPGGLPAGVLVSAARCPVPGCDETIDRTRLMCRRHWYRIPRRLRDRVWRTWRSGSAVASGAHQEAVLKAITAARIGRMPGWQRQLGQLRY
jgi:hypothetical protein